jgi:hypothetical protein
MGGSASAKQAARLGPADKQATLRRSEVGHDPGLSITTCVRPRCFTSSINRISSGRSGACAPKPPLPRLDPGWIQRLSERSIWRGGSLQEIRPGREGRGGLAELASGDPRRSVEERYGSQEGYNCAVRNAAERNCAPERAEGEAEFRQQRFHRSPDDQ